MPIVAGFALAAAALLAGCASEEIRPKELPALRKYFLTKAREKFEHAFRITKRHSPDPFNQAREQLVYTLVELEEFNEAEKVGREFIEQKSQYLEVARAKLAEVEIDYKKSLAADPSMEGSKKEKGFLDAIDEWKARIRSAEKRIVGLGLLLGEALLKQKNYPEAVSAFSDILRIVPDHNAALRRLGQAYAHIGQHAMAAATLEKAFHGMEKTIVNTRERLLEPETDAVQDKLQKRLETLERAAVEMASVVGVLHYLAGDITRSERWFARTFALDPTSKFVELKLAIALLVEGRDSAARKHLERFRKSLPERGASLFILLLDRLEMKRDS